MLPLYEPVIEEAGNRKESRKLREIKKLKKEVKSEITFNYLLYTKI